MSDIDALLEERRGYVARGLANRVAAVDAQLALLGHKVAKPTERADSAPAENAAQADAAKRGHGRPRKNEA